MINRQLLDFIQTSPTAFHAVENIAKELDKAGFSELCEKQSWEIKLGGNYYVRRNASSLIAFRIPEKAFSGFMIMAGHSDSPCFKLKAEPVLKSDSYTRLSVEKYGGMLCSTWMDRPLSAAGRVFYRKDGKIAGKLVDFVDALFIIPNLAIHMDRSANEGKSFNVNTDMPALMGNGEASGRFSQLLCSKAGIEEEELISSELFLYPCERGLVWGSEKEYISSPRLDDLQCVFACMKGFVEAEKIENASVLCVFDNEEVGSGTKQGADSDFLYSVLLRVSEALGFSAGKHRELLAGSFMVSADNAHAVHPNHPEYADSKDRPEMNKGVVIKYNANQRYTTDALSAAVFSEICRKAGVPVQRFSNRADLAGGSTLGNISSAHVSVNSVDIGLAQLAMHSAFETAGAKDTEYLVKAAAEFYRSTPDFAE